jgi:hypothetical protein
MSSLTLGVLSHVDEPGAAEGYADVLSQVATNGQPVIVRRAGEDFAAVVPLEYLELAQDAVARQKAEQLAATLDWKQLAKNSPPAQNWFDGDEPKPF